MAGRVHIFAISLFSFLVAVPLHADLTIDNFEEGDFFAENFEGNRENYAIQDDLNPANNIATRRIASVSMTNKKSTYYASAELATTNEADDEAVLYFAPETEASISLRSFDYDSNGVIYYDVSNQGDTFFVELTEAPTFGDMYIIIEFADYDPGVHAVVPLNGPGTYQIGFDDFSGPWERSQVWSLTLRFSLITDSQSSAVIKVADFSVKEPVIPCPELDSQLVEIDVVPDDETNSINLNSKKSKPIEVAVFGDPAFDVQTIDLTTILFADSLVVYEGSVLPDTHSSAVYGDLNGDGILDLLLTWDRDILVSLGALSSSTTQMSLVAEIDECGNLAYGEQEINIKGKGKNNRGNGVGKGKNK